MPLDRAKLKHVRKVGDRIRAQCPACAEAGRDSMGEHLSIDAAEKFGCAVYPGDHPHRQKIWALAGDGGKLPPYVAVCRPVTLRNKWKNPDVSDGCFQVGPERRHQPLKFSDATDGTSKPLRDTEKLHSMVGMGLYPSETSGATRASNTAPHSPALASITENRPPLVPMEAPWRDGHRYRATALFEVANRLDCYVADPNGPWIRRGGVLQAVHPKSDPGGNAR